MQKKKILHLITGLGIGGAEKMILQTLPKMQSDFDNRVCCITGRGPTGKKLEEAGIPVYYLDLRSIFDFGTILKFKKIAKEFRPDVLITYLIHADLFGRIFGRLFGIKTIICSQRGSLLQWEFLRFFDRLTKSLVTKYIVQTETAKKELMKKLNLPENIFVIIPNAINLEDFDFEINQEKKKVELGINLGNQNIICVSNLRRGKGHEYLIEAFEKINENNQALNLLIVGDGEQKNNLLQQVSDYDSKNNIYFLGNRNDIKEILKISDIFVLPTLAEGMSNAIMEAMSSKLAILTTNIDANKELIENEYSGILIPARNSYEIEDNLNMLLRDEEKRLRFGKNAHEEIKKRFSLEVAIKKITNLLNAI